MSIPMTKPPGTAARLIDWYADNAVRLNELAAARSVSIEKLLDQLVDDAVKSQPAPLLQVQDLRLDIQEYRLWQGDQQLYVARLQMGFLAALMSAPGKVVRRDEIAEDLWGARSVIVGKTIDMALSLLRRTLGDTAKGPNKVYRYVNTLRGVGWRFETIPYGGMWSEGE